MTSTQYPCLCTQGQQSTQHEGEQLERTQVRARSPKSLKWVTKGQWNKLCSRAHILVSFEKKRGWGREFIHWITEPKAERFIHPESGFRKTVFSAVHCIILHCVVVVSGEEPVAMACRAMDLASFSHASPLLLQLKTSHAIVAHCYGLAPFTAPAAVTSSSVVSVAQDRILSCGGGRLDMRGSTRKQGSTGTRSVAKSNSRTYLSLRNLFTESESTVNFLPPRFSFILWSEPRISGLHVFIFLVLRLLLSLLVGRA